MTNFSEDIYQLLLTTISFTDKWFFFHMVINLLINTVAIPLLDQYSVTSIIDDEYGLGIRLFVIISVVECISSAHKIYFMEPHKTIFKAISHQVVENYTLEKLEMVSHSCQKTLLDADFLTKKNAVKWNLIGLMGQLLDNFIQFIPLLGYIVWIGYQSPITIVTYAVVIVLYMKYAKTDSIEWATYDKNWKKYNRIRNNQYSDLIHGKGERSRNKMSELMYDHEIICGKDRLFDTKYTENINTVFNVITIINCLFVFGNTYDGSLRNTDKAFIVLYIQYIRLLKNSLHMFTSVVQQWKTSEKEHKNYNELFANTITMGETPKQISFDNMITIKAGSQFYRESNTIATSTEPKIDNKIDKKMVIDVRDTIVFKKGSVIYVAGPSGAGKTTLFDIMAGIIKHTQTNFLVMIDNLDVSESDGFEHIKSLRTYLATDIHVNIGKTSVCEIITSNSPYINTLMVWEAIRMSECSDFVNSENLYSEDIKVSKGQTNRLKVARYIYDILICKPSMVLLDEIADGVDPETTTKIAANIYSYIRKNAILCLVTTHLPYLQQMKYDGQINIAAGVITS